MSTQEHAPLERAPLDHRPASLTPRQEQLVARRAPQRLESAGRPLDAGMLDEVGRTTGSSATGHDFSAIRLHSDRAANETAAMLGANAATIGSDVLFAPGRLQPGTPSGRALIAHEARHVLEAPRVAAPRIQLDVISDVRDKLSYGLLDWAVTDSDALEALALLSSLTDAQLTAGAAKLEQKYIDRLIDNLPDAAKAGAGYQRVITAFGGAKAAPQAKDLLSYGLFDWAVTDNDVTKVYQTFVALSGVEQEKFLTELNTSGHLARLVSNSTAAHHTLYLRPWVAQLPSGKLTPEQRRILRVVVQETGSDAIATMILAAQQRFGLTVGQSTAAGLTPTNWTAGKLRETYLALDLLPEAHVAGNVNFTALNAFTQATKPDGTTLLGQYNPGSKQLSINVAVGDDVTETALHETGHSVDRTIGWTTGPEPALPKRGGWTQYKANFSTAADDMIADSAGAVAGLAAPQITAVRTEIVTAMTNRSAVGMVGRVQALPWFAPLPQATKDAVVADKVFPAVTVGLKDPWFMTDGGGQKLGTAPVHIYEESYPSSWNRYEFQARDRILTPYQFRDPAEWFAEAYALYYLPDVRGKGRKLQDKDPDTKTYFDASVDPTVATR